MICTRCKKNVAVLFITKLENGKRINEGLCIPCARELGINPMGQLAGGIDLDMESFENINEQMSQLIDDAEQDPAGLEEVPGGFDGFLKNIMNVFTEGKASGEKDNPKNE